MKIIGYILFGVTSLLVGHLIVKKLHKKCNKHESSHCGDVMGAATH